LLSVSQIAEWLAGFEGNHAATVEGAATGDKRRERERGIYAFEVTSPEPSEP